MNYVLGLRDAVHLHCYVMNKENGIVRKAADDDGHRASSRSNWRAKLALSTFEWTAGARISRVVSGVSCRSQFLQKADDETSIAPWIRNKDLDLNVVE